MAPMRTFELRVAVSNSHVHLTEEHARMLFGTEQFDGSSTGHAKFIRTKSTVTLRGPRGSLDGVRVLAPCSKETWVELNRTHAHALGVRPPLEEGPLPESLHIGGPKGEVEVNRNVVIEGRHIEVTREQAATWVLRDGQMVSAEVDGPRALVFKNVKVRILSEARAGFDGCLELDRDEANAAFVSSGDRARIIVE